ncbi:MAG: histidine kinase [Moorea sp. SIO3G5]|nr:histidine kinase [Moorena sp. SIO3G5]
MQAATETYTNSPTFLQLLLFVDERPGSRKQLQSIHHYLETLKTEYPFELKVVDVGEQPYLAEHFKLVATPALIKINPKPKQTLAGSNLVAQLKNWWPRWQRSLEENQTQLTQGFPLQPTVSSSNSSAETSPETAGSLACALELIRLSDEVFRLKKDREELLEQLQFKDQVISMLAHDLRSPLTAASIALETLQLEQPVAKNGRKSGLTPQLKARLFEQARNQLRIINRMVVDLLQARKGSNAEFNIRPHKLNFGRLCQDVLVQMHEQFQLKAQVVQTDIPQDLPPVYGDEELVRQVLINLLDNAIKYTPKGGKIAVSSIHRTTQKVQFSVCDDGPGIPQENRDRIFENHFRLKRDEAIEGYGLGLALCQKIIRAHYGRIWVDSPIKGGSCFHFTLPIYR